MQRIATAALVLLLVGCETLTQYGTPQNVRTAVSLSTNSILNATVSPADRTRVANYLWSAARGIRTFEGGRIPTQDELRNLILRFTTNGERWVQYANGLATVWGAVYPRLNGNVHLALEYLEAIAAGIEDSIQQPP